MSWHPGEVQLAPEARAALERLVRCRGIARASKTVGAGEATVERAILKIGVKRATAERLEARLRELGEVRDAG